jgi:hypothetical protein
MGRALVHSSQVAFPLLFHDHKEAYSASAEPTGAFIRLLASAIGSGSAHIADHDGGAPEGLESAWGWRLVRIGTGENAREDWREQGVRAGWIVGDNLYLDRDAS